MQSLASIGHIPIKFIITFHCFFYDLREQFSVFYDDMRAGRNIFENRRNHYFHTKSFNCSESSRKINMRHMGFTNFRKFSLIIIFKTCFSPDVSRKNKFKFFGSKVPILVDVLVILM